MVNQLTDGWRRPWTASRGSLHQPAWPVQLSETTRKPTRHPSGAKAPLGHLDLHGLGPARTRQLPHRSITPAGSSPWPHTALRSTASPAPGPTGCHVRTPGQGGSLHTPPSDCYLKYTGSPPFLAPLVHYSCWDRSGREMLRFLCLLLPSSCWRARALSWKDLHFGNHHAVSFQELRGLWGLLPFATWRPPGLK